jgi:hypothetical protein
MARYRMTVSGDFVIRIRRHFPVSFFTVANQVIRADLLSMELMLDLEQYKLIRGLLMYNLGEDLQREVPSQAADTKFVDIEKVLQAHSDPSLHVHDSLRSLRVRCYNISLMSNEI